MSTADRSFPSTLTAGPATAAAAPTRRPWFAAAGVSAATSLLFMIVYPLCNYLSARRAHVEQIYWPWEFAIPLIPALIVPYMSIDALFVSAPFLCTSRQELFTLGRRLAAATVLAAVCFLAYPLRLGFPRVEVPGLFGPIFAFLFAADHPFNLFPSLHITLAFILRWTYHRHLRGVLLWLFHLWFALISVSTLLVHQHQVVDLLGGGMLAFTCFYLFPSGPGDYAPGRYRATTRTRKCARYYGGGAALLAALAWWWGGWMLLALWPALSLGLLSLAYAGAGTRIFQKRRGRLSWPARAMLAPYLLGLWLSRRYYWRRDPGPAQITPGVLLGSVPRGAVLGQLIKQQAAIIDLTAEHNAPAALQEHDYLRLPVLDLTAPDVATLLAAVDWIAARNCSARDAAPVRPVYIHCGLGLGRSAALAAAWLLYRGAADSPQAAVDQVRQLRPGAAASPDVLQALSDYHVLVRAARRQDP